MKKIIPLLILLLSILLSAQNEPLPTSSKERLESLMKREQIDKNNILQNVKFRNVGPTIMSGRVTDLEVDPQNPNHFYVSYATGGLWETYNNGISYNPLFDNEVCMTIGSIAVDWNSGTIWIGSGEANAFTWAGLGIFKSVDKGKTWSHVGLEETQHINQIIIHPENPDIVWVAAMGRLYSSNDERGVYKSTDGGKSWQRTLFVDDSTGISDLIIDPKNPDILYASGWERWRKSWMRHKGGKGSGIFKSVDGGETWERLNKEGSGLPVSSGVGRIGLTVSESDPNILYATVDNQDRYVKKDKDDDSDKLKKEIFRQIDKKEFLDISDAKLDEFLKDNGFPKKYSAETVKRMVEQDEIKPVTLYEYLVDTTDPEEDDRPIYGAEIYRSNDAGKTWVRTHTENLDGLFYSYGYVFDIIRVSPTNPDKIYVAGVPILASEDGGKTFKDINKENVHVDHHALWINPNDDNHIINGNDGGVNISYDGGEHWFKSNPEAVSQCYAVQFDMAEPYNIYTGMQDNGTWMGPSTYRKDYSWQQEGKYPYESLMGGDGFQIQVDFRDNDVMYLGWQYGNYYRYTKSTNEYKTLEVKHDLGERTLRWNWETPILLSRHNQDILYIGANRLFRTMDKGETFSPISPDLTKGGRKGEVKYGTITTISESPKTFGLIYVGTDDGNIQVTKDGGVSWLLITKGLPENLWISRVEASSHTDGVVYVSMNGLKWDNYKSYLFVSEDYGDTWKEIGTDLPEDMINVVREDPVNENILYVGNQIGVYVSLDKGKSFLKMTNGIPNVAVFDLKIQPRENDLIVGTHGRSVYLADIRHIQKLTEEFMKKEIHIFDLAEVKYSEEWGDSYSPWDKAKETKIEIPYYCNSSVESEIKIRTNTGLELFSFKDESEKGLNYAEYNLEFKGEMADKLKDILKEKSEIVKKIKKKDNGKFYLVEGEYEILIKSKDRTNSTKLVIK